MAKKMSMKQDKAYDKKHGIKEGSPKDMQMDKVLMGPQKAKKTKKAGRSRK